MKKNRLFAFLLALACVVQLAIPSSAATIMASSQIVSYSMTTTVSTGTLNVAFSIVGKGYMDKIGCQSIYIYEKVGTSWSFVESRLEDDTGMSVTDAYAHMNTIYCDGEAGVSYKVVVTVFAENSAGRDARTKTFYVTGQ